jgi:hypothetical protein
MTDISNSANIINLSDVTDRVDELREERADHDASHYVARNEDGTLSAPYLDEDEQPNADTWEGENTDEAEELARLETLLESIENGGSRDHEWNGGHYPATLIAENHFAQYAQETAEECGDISRHASYIVVDWEKTAEGLKQDYKQVDYDGETFWYRA